MSENPEPLLCRCWLIPERVVRDAIVSKKLRTVEDVTVATKAATGCSSCYDDIQAILDEVSGRKPKPKAPQPSSYAVTFRQVQDTIASMDSALKSNAVEIRLVDVDDERVLARVLAPGGDTATPAILALKRTFVEELSRACGRRMQLIEINQVEAWRSKPAP